MRVHVAGIAGQCADATLRAAGSDEGEAVGDGRSVSNSWARKRDRRMGAQEIGARQHTPGPDFLPIGGRRRFAVPSRRSRAKELETLLPSPAPAAGQRGASGCGRARCGVAVIGAQTTSASNVHGPAFGHSTPFPRSAKGRRREKSMRILGTRPSRAGERSAPVCRWVEIRGLACVAWPRISGHPSDGHACVPRIRIDFFRRLRMNPQSGTTRP